MKCRIIPLFAAVASVPMLFGATPLNAQEAQRWTLEECIAYAFEHNIEVKQAELDVQTKRLTRSDAGWAYAPDISASSSYSFSSGRVLDPTTYEFVEHQSVNGTSTSVGASVTLFNGMRNLHNLERSRLDLRAALLGVEKARNDIRLNITAYYLEILCAEENIRNAEQTVETLKIQEEKTRKSVEMGKVTSADLLQIRSQLANAENTLLSARNSYDIARLNICQLLEIEDYTTFHTVAPSDNILGNTPMPVSTDALLASAQQLRFMNRIRNAKIRIIVLFCCALWASGVLTGILVRTSLPKAIPKSIPKPNPICGYKNPTIIPMYIPMVCHRLVAFLFLVCVSFKVSITFCFVCRPTSLRCCLHGKYFLVCYG